MAAARYNTTIPTVLVDGDRNFNENVKRYLNLADENGLIGAVSIIGAQGAGKSTFMNACFGASFKTRDVKLYGMRRTTHGIWIEKCTPPNGGRKILVIDTEGSDGDRQREARDDTFEKKVTLFALAMSNTVIYYMNCDQVGQCHGSGQPLLETVFEVMVQKFSTPRRVNLVFVLRDYNDCPLDLLKQQLKEGLTKIWQRMPKPRALANKKVDDYFKIEVNVLLSSFKYERPKFDMEVEGLRDTLTNMVQRSQLEPAAGFLDLAERNWKDIDADKTLNLQLNRITVAEVFCHRIKEEKIQNFRTDKAWLGIKRNVESKTSIPSFGKKVNQIIANYLTQYDEATEYFDKSQTEKTKEQLTENLLQDVERTYLSLVEAMRSAIFGNFQEICAEEIKRTGKLQPMPTGRFLFEFSLLLADADVEGANWDIHKSQQQEKLKSELNSFNKRVEDLNTRLKEQKKNGAKFWSGIALLGTSVLAYSVGIAVAIMVPGVGTAAISCAASLSGALQYSASAVMASRQDIFGLPRSQDGNLETLCFLYPKVYDLVKQE